MSKIWFFFNTAQLISSFPYISSLKLPANVLILQKAYEKMIFLKIIPDGFGDWIKAHIFGNFADDEILIHEKYLEATANSTRHNEEESDSKDGKPKSVKDALTEKETVEVPAGRRTLIVERIPEKQVVRNQVISVSAIAFICLAAGLLYYFRIKIWNELHVKIQRAIVNFYHSVFWSGIIRAMLELYYPAVLFAMIKLIKRQGSYFWPMVTLIVYGLFILGTFMHLQHNRPEVSSQDYLQSYGAYFTNIETLKKPKALHYSTIFLLRRLFCAVIISLMDQVVFQIMFIIYSSLAMLCWIASVQPCETRGLNAMEMCNEALVIACAYYLIMFTDYVKDPELRYMFGWGYIALIALGLIGNMLVVLISSCRNFKELIIQIRRWNQGGLFSLKKEATKTALPGNEIVFVADDTPENTFAKLAQGQLTTQALIAQTDLKKWLAKQVGYKDTLEQERQKQHEFDQKIADQEKGTIELETDAAATMSVFPKFGGKNKVGVFNMKEDPLQAIFDLQEKQREELAEESEPEYEWDGNEEEFKEEEDYEDIYGNNQAQINRQMTGEGLDYHVFAVNEFNNRKFSVGTEVEENQTELDFPMSREEDPYGLTTTAKKPQYLHQSSEKLIDNFYRDIDSIMEPSAQEEQSESQEEQKDIGMSVDDINQYYDKMMSELTQNQKKVEIDNEVHKVLQFQEMMLKQLDFVDQDPEHHAETPEPEITRPKTVIKLRKKKGRPSIGKEFDPKEEFNRRRSVEAHMDLEDLFD